MNGVNPLLVDLHAPFLRPVLSDDVSSSKYSFLERSINYESYESWMIEILIIMCVCASFSLRRGISWYLMEGNEGEDL